MSSKKQRIKHWRGTDRIITRDVLSFLGSHDLLCALGRTSHEWKSRSTQQLPDVCRSWDPRGRPPAGYFARHVDRRALHLVFCSTEGWDLRDLETAQKHLGGLQGIIASQLGFDDAAVAAWIREHAATLRTFQMWQQIPRRFSSCVPPSAVVQRVIPNDMLGGPMRLNGPHMLSDLNTVRRLDLIILVPDGEKPHTLCASQLAEKQGAFVKSETGKEVNIWFVKQTFDGCCAEWMVGSQVVDSILLETLTRGNVTYCIWVHSQLFG